MWSKSVAVATCWICMRTKRSRNGIGRLRNGCQQISSNGSNNECLDDFKRNQSKVSKGNEIQWSPSVGKEFITRQIHNSSNSRFSFEIFQRLIDYSGDFTLGQFRLVMNIICSIAYSEPQCEDLKDQLDMLVKKQVSSSIRNVKNRGIIAVIRVIDHMVWERKGNNQESPELDNSYSTIDALPTKLSKVAANYIGIAIRTDSLLSEKYLLPL